MAYGLFSRQPAHTAHDIMRSHPTRFVDDQQTIHSNKFIGSARRVIVDGSAIRVSRLPAAAPGRGIQSA